MSRRRSDTIARIRSLFVRGAEAGQPKHVQLRKAVLATIRGGTLEAGGQIPPERELAGAVGLSLGTVRRTLDELALDGIVARAHGRGTFVTTIPRAISDSWHFRFWEDGDADRLLPVYSQVLQRGVVRSQGPWSRYLGHDRRGYVRIERRFNVDDRFLSFSDFYLRASRFRAMAELPMAEIEGVNLKNVLSEQFGTPTLYVSQRVRAEPLPAKACRIMSVKPRSWGLFLEIVGYSLQNTPISYHAIWVPATEHKLDLTLHGLESPLGAGASTPGWRPGAAITSRRQRSAPWT